jgi:putative colanic acid biosynthesis UDP-glucose lipid carrier transferase
LERGTLLSLLEAGLEPVIIVFSLCGTAIYIKGMLPVADLMLSLLLFSITFPGAARLSKSVRQMIGEVLLHWMWVVLLLGLAAYATGYFYEFSPKIITVWLMILPTALVFGHLLLRWLAPFLVRLQGPPRRAVVVGMNEQGVALASKITSTPYSRIEVVGFFDDRTLDRLDASMDYRLIAPLEELPEYVRNKGVNLIYLSIPMASQPRILQVLDNLKDTTASIFFVPDMFVTDLIQGRSGLVCGMPVISVCETPFTGWNGVIKRISDIVLSIIILILISPLMAFVAAAVKWTSPGPVIFKQRRYGLDGKQILVYKFRSMTVTEDGAKVQQATKNDNRVTPLGAILRKTSIDELPQFVNVLQGRMSIVGPRPHAVAHNEMYRKLIKGYMVRHKVKPGITGWAQVNGYRGETDTLDKMDGRIKFDLDYLRNWSIMLDLYVIYKTIRVVLKDDQAY